jgi:hypothetical protein
MEIIKKEVSRLSNRAASEKAKKCRWADLHRRFPDYESGDIATNPQRQNCSVSSHRGSIFALLDTAVVDAHQ